MKNLNRTDKIVFFFNSVFATVLLLSYLLPYAAPRHFAVLSILSLTVPLLIILNVLFIGYWFIKGKRQLVLSLVVLLIGFSHVSSLYKFSSGADVENEISLSVMNYNVRLFNLYNWIPEWTIGYFENIAWPYLTRSPESFSYL